MTTITTITPLEALDKLVIINLETTIWAARKKMSATDFDGVELPPADLASLGSKRICDPSRIAIFNRLKARAVTMLDKKAVRFLGGWALPEAVTDETLAYLRDVRAEFYAAKAEFLAEYDTAIADWVSKHGEWRELIANSTVSSNYVDDRLHFGWQLFKAAQPVASTDSTLSDSVACLGNTLFQEIAKDAAEIWRDVLEGKLEVTHKALSPIQTLRNKLHGLAFVSPHALPVVEIIDAVLNDMPTKGKYIVGRHLVNLQGLVCLLKDTQAVLRQSEAMLAGASSSNSALSKILSGFSTTPATVIPAPTIPATPLPTTPCLDSCGLW